MIDKIPINKPNFLEIDVVDISRIGHNTAGSLFRRIKTELVGQIFYSKSDTFRKVPLRLLGYGYAVAEALRSRVNNDQESNPFCMLAGGFIICHCLDRMLAVAEESDGWGRRSKQNRPTDMLIAFCDTFVWEALASVTIPTFLTYCAVRMTDILLEILCTECQTIRKWLPVMVGIAIIPLFMVTVDNFVDRLMDDTIREIYAPSFTRLAI
ncbi:unnamed protein product [Candidula unifasciata]|uniref:Mitochondrial fission process protein 1 n=1 Tax=Candidula unifasciata TaxID=100452 RepID=A0A8S3YUM0_9EUPU|nr:unnamed protein product [Candidula unifasciata]